MRQWEQLKVEWAQVLVPHPMPQRCWDWPSLVPGLGGWPAGRAQDTPSHHVRITHCGFIKLPHNPWGRGWGWPPTWPLLSLPDGGLGSSLSRLSACAHSLLFPQLLSSRLPRPQTAWLGRGECDSTRRRPVSPGTEEHRGGEWSPQEERVPAVGEGWVLHLPSPQCHTWVKALALPPG